MNDEKLKDLSLPAFQRRIRYKGTHPKTFSEKYKELQPEQYAEDVARVIQKGRTPAGMHLPICVNEIMDVLQIQAGQTGLDATLGYGGHALEILKRLEKTGCLYAMDVDGLELPRTAARLASLGYGPEFLQTRQMNFSQIDWLTRQSGPFDFILADLGVSSMQIDNPHRGFSFKRDGPLDLRLNPLTGVSASDLLKSLSAGELQGILVENADEPYAAPIAGNIMSAIKKGSGIQTTKRLQRVIRDTLKMIPNVGEEEIKKATQRCFQALRIEVNQELEALYEFLEKLPEALSRGGRAAILTFHSGEDRLVKKSFKHLLNEGIYLDAAREPIRPSRDECFANSRARSAKLRWAIKA